MFYQSMIFVGLLLFFVSQSVIAQTVSGTLAVTAQVGTMSTCVFSSVASMIYPNYNPIDPNADNATATILVTCSAGIPYDVGINKGLGPGATEASRLMTKLPTSGSASFLSYGLFQDSNCTNNWGDILGENTMPMMGNNLPQLINVYGKINPGQQVEPGIYIDRVTIIIIF